MRKITLALITLAIFLCLVSCNHPVEGKRIGESYQSPQGVKYTPISSNYSATNLSGDPVFDVKDGANTLHFYAIGSLSSNEYVCDNYGTLYVSSAAKNIPSVIDAEISMATMYEGDGTVTIKTLTKSEIESIITGLNSTLKYDKSLLFGYEYTSYRIVLSFTGSLQGITYTIFFRVASEDVLDNQDKNIGTTFLFDRDSGNYYSIENILGNPS